MAEQKQLAAPQQPAVPGGRRRQPSYFVDYTLRKEFSVSEMTEYQRIFRAFDADNNGSIDREELKQVMKALGLRDISGEAIDAFIREVDLNDNKCIEFNEFLRIFLRMKKGEISSDSVVAKVVTKGGELMQVKGVAGVHSFAEEEKVAFTEHINRCLGRDADVAYMLPISAEGLDLFKACSTGVVLCKLINCACPGTIDERALNLRQNLNVFQTVENLNLCLEAAKSIGCTVVNIHVEDIQEGRRPHLILALIWQIVKIQFLSAINLKSHPELIRLLEENEELGDLLKLPAEQLLLRWFNYHLKNANHPRRVANFGADIKDSECYTVLLHQIAPELCTTEALTKTDMQERASLVLRNAGTLGVDAFIQPRDIVQGNQRLNLAFCASIFNTNPGLVATEEEQYQAAQLLDDDVEGTREERAFRMWINSLNIEDVYVQNLYEDLKDGLIALKVLDKVQPGIVQWRQVAFKPNNKFKKVGNCNYVVVLGKQLKFSLVGIGGIDVVNGNKKLVLAYVWQLMRLHCLQVLGNFTEADLVEWANRAVASRGRQSRVTSLSDPSLTNGLFLMDLLFSIEPRAVNWDLVKPGETEEEIELNCKYVLSVARKLGVTVFCTWEDIRDVKHKMLLTLVAGLARVAKKEKKTEEKKEQEAH